MSKEVAKKITLTDKQAEWLKSLSETWYVCTDKNHTVALSECPLYHPERQEYCCGNPNARVQYAPAEDKNCECEDECDCEPTNVIDLGNGRTYAKVKELLDELYPDRNKLQNLNTVRDVIITSPTGVVTLKGNVVKAEVIDGKMIVEVR